MTDNELRDIAHRIAVKQLKSFEVYWTHDPALDPLGYEDLNAIERLVNNAQVIIGA